MKCPKCAYLGYEPVDRCRNCGHEFMLHHPAPTPDLRLRDGGATPSPIDDLEFVDRAARPGRHARGAATLTEPDPRPAGEPAIAELPLFGPPIADDVPLITRPSAPRQPLSVRRATPEVARLRAEPRAPLLEWPSDPQPPAPPLRAVRRPEVSPVRSSTPEHSGSAATIAARGVAAVIDVVLIAAVDLVVVYFTLKICRLELPDWRLLPRGPLLTFLLVQNGGYLVSFTAVGQTVGKMIAGVRVLADDHDGSPDFGRAALRTLIWLPLALPAGIGLLSAGLHADRRGWHDRFAGTRVVSTRA